MRVVFVDEDDWKAGWELEKRVASAVLDVR
jgi:hypothetical protein